MGGFGSTRWKKHRRKLLVGEAPVLDINKLWRFFREEPEREWHYVQVGSGIDQITAKLRLVSDPKSINPMLELRYQRGMIPTEQIVRLYSTMPYFGGTRVWFRCPRRVGDKTCFKRVTRLYLTPKGPGFGCRHCCGLTYRKPTDNPVEYPDEDSIFSRPLPVAKKDSPERRARLAEKIYQKQVELERLQEQLGKLNRRVIAGKYG